MCVRENMSVREKGSREGASWQGKWERVWCAALGTSCGSESASWCSSNTKSGVCRAAGTGMGVGWVQECVLGGRPPCPGHVGGFGTACASAGGGGHQCTADDMAL
jgi:hypothetical protein